MTLETFKKLIGWLEEGHNEIIDWEEGLKLPYYVLLKIAESFGNEIYIGIQGGAEALKRIKKDDADTIKNRSWGIANSPKTSQWIDGETFAEIVKDKLSEI